MRQRANQPNSTPAPILTSEEARKVPLSRNPVKRLRQLKYYGSAFGCSTLIWSPLPRYMTRGDLVHRAESREKAEILLNVLKQSDDER